MISQKKKFEKIANILANEKKGMQSIKFTSLVARELNISYDDSLIIIRKAMAKDVIRNVHVAGNGLYCLPKYYYHTMATAQETARAIKERNKQNAIKREKQITEHMDLLLSDGNRPLTVKQMREELGATKKLFFKIIMNQREDDLLLIASPKVIK